MAPSRRIVTTVVATHRRGNQAERTSSELRQFCVDTVYTIMTRSQKELHEDNADGSNARSNAAGAEDDDDNMDSSNIELVLSNVLERYTETAYAAAGYIVKAVLKWLTTHRLVCNGVEHHTVDLVDHFVKPVPSFEVDPQAPFPRFEIKWHYRVSCPFGGDITHSMNSIFVYTSPCISPRVFESAAGLPPRVDPAYINVTIVPPWGQRWMWRGSKGSIYRIPAARVEWEDTRVTEENEREEQNKRLVAFGMGLRDRLGKDSVVKDLSVEVVDVILRVVLLDKCTPCPITQRLLSTPEPALHEGRLGWITRWAYASDDGFEVRVQDIGRTEVGYIERPRQTNQ